MANTPNCSNEKSWGHLWPLSFSHTPYPGLFEICHLCLYTISIIRPSPLLPPWFNTLYLISQEWQLVVSWMISMLPHPPNPSPLQSVFNIAAREILLNTNQVLWLLDSTLPVSPHVTRNKSQSTYSRLQHSARSDFSLRLWPHVLPLSFLLLIHVISGSPCSTLGLHIGCLLSLGHCFPMQPHSSLPHLLHVFEFLLKCVFVIFSGRAVFSALFNTVMTYLPPTPCISELLLPSPMLLFSYSIYHHITYYEMYLVIMFIVSFPPLECKLHKSGRLCLLCSLIQPRHLEQGLSHGRSPLIFVE